MDNSPRTHLDLLDDLKKKCGEIIDQAVDEFNLTVPDHGPIQRLKGNAHKYSDKVFL